MAKNYIKETGISHQLLPRKEVIESILNYSKMHIQKSKKLNSFDFLKN